MSGLAFADHKETNKCYEYGSSHVTASHKTSKNKKKLPCLVAF